MPKKKTPTDYEFEAALASRMVNDPIASLGISTPSKTTLVPENLRGTYAGLYSPPGLHQWVRDYYPFEASKDLLPEDTAAYLPFEENISEPALLAHELRHRGVYGPRGEVGDLFRQTAEGLKSREKWPRPQERRDQLNLDEVMNRVQDIIFMSKSDPGAAQAARDFLTNPAFAPLEEVDRLLDNMDTLYNMMEYAADMQPTTFNMKEIKSGLKGIEDFLKWYRKKPAPPLKLTK